MQRECIELPLLTPLLFIPVAKGAKGDGTAQGEGPSGIASLFAPFSWEAIDKAVKEAVISTRVEEAELKGGHSS